MRLAARTRGIDSGGLGIVAGVRPAFAALRRRIFCPGQKMVEAAGIEISRHVKKFIQTHFVCFQCPAPSIGRFVKVTETDIPKYNDTAPRPIAPQLAAKKNS